VSMDKEQKHTPGPWAYYTEPQPNGCPIVGSRGLMIAMLAQSINHDDQRETAIANARLIAAAPALLEALRGLVTRYKFDGIPNDSLPFIEAARAAITSATRSQP
jgi:hypothetical protein